MIKQTNKRSVVYTTKQMGDACEMLVAAELTLAGIPALRVPDLWPGYDVIAQPRDRSPQRIQVKSRTYKAGGGALVKYDDNDDFDWLAIVLLPGGTQTERSIFVIPRAVVETKAKRDKPSSKTASKRYWRIDQVANLFSEYEQNFTLNVAGASH